VNIIDLVGLTKQFGQLVALDRVNLSVEEGEIRGLIGPNGSGKTTMFNLISGFIRPTSGKVVWRGCDMTGEPPHKVVKAGIARTFQLNVLLNEMSVLQNVIMAYHLQSSGFLEQLLRRTRAREKEKILEEKAMGLLETLGLAQIKDNIAGDLPHGHQRALSIAIALANEPKLLLLDEPLAGMNPAEKADMMLRIQDMRDSGITILLVEHDMRSVMSVCEKISVLNFGIKIAEGTPEEISDDKNVVEAYLG
jgi:branched-chain amino acid transport system ATP-binding protein